MEKVINFLANRVKTFAVKNWQRYAIKQEWLTVILLLLLTKLSTSAISIFGGYQYLQNLFFGLINSETAANTFSIIALLLIEGLAALFLAKFFKFALRMQWATALMPLFFAVLVFAVSFITSTNGIAVYTAKGVDLSKEINGKYNTQLEGLKADYEAEAAIVKDHINSIKNNPEEWKDGKRCVLSKAQNMQLTTCYNKLNELKIEYNNSVKDIKADQKIELADNDANTTNEANKYYNIVAVIMAIQVICSGALWWFWCKISGEDQPEIDAKEGVKAIYDNAAELIRGGVDTCINTEFNRITTAFTLLNNELALRQIDASKRAKEESERQFQIAAEATGQPLEVVKGAADEGPAADETAEKSTPSAPEKKHKIFKVIGFNSDVEPVKITTPEPAENEQKTSNPEPQHSEPHGPVVSPSENEQKNAVNNTRVCKLCGREFQPRAWNQKFCEPAHKDEYWRLQGLNLDNIKKANSRK